MSNKASTCLFYYIYWNDMFFLLHFLNLYVLFIAFFELILWNWPNCKEFQKVPVSSGSSRGQPEPLALDQNHVLVIFWVPVLVLVPNLGVLVLVWNHVPVEFWKVPVFQFWFWSLKTETRNQRKQLRYAVLALENLGSMVFIWDTTANIFCIFISWGFFILQSIQSFWCSSAQKGKTPE